MPHARRRDPAPPLPDLARIFCDAELVRTKVTEHLTAVTAVLEAARNGQMTPDDRRQLALVAAGLRQAGAGLLAYADQAALQGFAPAADEVMCADADAEGFKRGVAVASGGRHRAPRHSRRPGKGQLTLIPGEGRPAAPAATGAVVAGLTVVRHSAALKTALAGTAAAGVVLTAGGYANLPDITRLPVAHHHAASALSFTDPVNAHVITLPSPSPVAAYTPRHAKPAPDNDAPAATLSASATQPAPVTPSWTAPDTTTGDSSPSMDAWSQTGTTQADTSQAGQTWQGAQQGGQDNGPGSGWQQHGQQDHGNQWPQGNQQGYGDHQDHGNQWNGQQGGFQSGPGDSWTYRDGGQQGGHDNGGWQQQGSGGQGFGGHGNDGGGWQQSGHDGGGSGHGH